MVMSSSMASPTHTLNFLIKLWHHYLVVRQSKRKKRSDSDSWASGPGLQLPTLTVWGFVASRKRRLWDKKHLTLGAGLSVRVCVFAHAIVSQSENKKSKSALLLLALGWPGVQGVTRRPVVVLVTVCVAPLMKMMRRLVVPRQCVCVCVLRSRPSLAFFCVIAFGIVIRQMLGIPDFFSSVTHLRLHTVESVPTNWLSSVLHKRFVAFLWR